MANKIFISVGEFCSAFAVGRTKFYQLVAAGEVETAKVGSRRLVLVASAIDFASRCIQAQERFASVSSGASRIDRLPLALCYTHRDDDSVSVAPKESIRSDSPTLTSEPFEPKADPIQGGR